jgi:hypothetical protein
MSLNLPYDVDHYLAPFGSRIVTACWRKICSAIMSQAGGSILIPILRAVFDLPQPTSEPATRWDRGYWPR